MAKKKSLFNLVKRLFISEAKAKSEKREKRWRWIFGRFKLKRLASLSAPSPVKERTLIEAEEEHSKHALTVAIATAAAAEAAVAAAEAAVEVVRLTGTPRSYHYTERGIRNLAAIKIQTAFRGYLARKALRALKGLVKLQAMVRGRAVRRQAITTLKGLQSLVKIQTQVRAKRVKMVEKSQIVEEKKQLLRHNMELGDKETSLDLNIQRKWDDSLESKEEMNSIFLSRQGSLIKREHIKEYLFSNRERRNIQSLIESEPNNVNGRLSHWLEQWVDAQERKRQGPGNLDSVVFSNQMHRDIEGQKEFRLRELQTDEQLEGMDSPRSFRRRSFHQPKRSWIPENDSFSSSSAIPNYMSATESAKAKARSISMPKQRLGVLETYSDHGSPSKNRFASFSSMGSDATSIGKIVKPPSSQQRSPRMKGLSGPIKSHRTLKDRSFDSECSLLNWDQQSAFR